MKEATANPLLDEIEALQDQVLAELDELNQRIETVLKIELATDAAGDVENTSDPAGESTVDKSTRHTLPMVIAPQYLHLTTFLPARVAG